MKLNPDCIRDVLLYLEDNLSYVEDETSLIEHNTITATTIVNDLREKYDYEADDIKYSIEKLLEIRYIVSHNIVTGDNRSIISCPISDITYDGHQFLNTIRPDTIWQATKKGASKIGLMSMHTLSTIAMEIAKAVVTDPTVIAKIVGMM